MVLSEYYMRMVRFTHKKGSLGYEYPDQLR